MTRAPIVMYAIAGVAGLGGIGLLFVRAQSEGAIYARRMGTTMLLALGLILAIFAHALASWGPSA